MWSHELTLEKSAFFCGFDTLYYSAFVSNVGRFLRSFLAFALRILSAHNLWRHLARPRARVY